jgi:hypothetical protein
MRVERLQFLGSEQDAVSRNTDTKGSSACFPRSHTKAFNFGRPVKTSKFDVSLNTPVDLETPEIERQKPEFDDSNLLCEVMYT